MDVGSPVFLVQQSLFASAKMTEGSRSVALLLEQTAFVVQT